jgi:hypothetical protein
MELENLLAQSKTAILKKWFTLVVETYPPDTARFLKKQKDPFANPVGRTILGGLEDIFDALLKGADREALSSCLYPIIRIRALQDFAPSQAISFVFTLKKVLREELDEEIQGSSQGHQVERELLRFESRVDQLSLIAFDIYMERREKLYEIKATEARKTTFKAFERAGLIEEVSGKKPDLKKT